MNVSRERSRWGVSIWVAGAVLLAAALGGVALYRAGWRITRILPAEALPAEAGHEQFLRLLDPGIELNTAITLEPIVPAVRITQASRNPNDVHFLVLNHSDEEIEFPDQGFGIEAYGFDAASNSWRRIELGARPLASPVVLPPNPEGIDLEANNLGVVYERHLPPERYDRVRYLVWGVGLETGTTYGAVLQFEHLP